MRDIVAHHKHTGVLHLNGFTYIFVALNPGLVDHRHRTVLIGELHDSILKRHLKTNQSKTINNTR